jgi:hypothetical protein
MGLICRHTVAGTQTWVESRGEEYLGRKLDKFIEAQSLFYACASLVRPWFKRSGFETARYSAVFGIMRCMFVVTSAQFSLGVERLSEKPRRFSTVD